MYPKYWSNALKIVVVSRVANNPPTHSRPVEPVLNSGLSDTSKKPLCT